MHVQDFFSLREKILPPAFTTLLFLSLSILAGLYKPWLQFLSIYKYFLKWNINSTLSSKASLLEGQLSILLT